MTDTAFSFALMGTGAVAGSLITLAVLIIARSFPMPALDNLRLAFQNLIGAKGSIIDAIGGGVDPAELQTFADGINQFVADAQAAIAAKNPAPKPPATT